VASVLIPTRGNDPDATYVAAAIRLKGHHARLWLTADYPARQSQSFAFGIVPPEARVSSPFGAFDVLDIDAIWLRRPTWPYSAHLATTEEDQTYLRATGRRYHMSLWTWLEQSAFFRRDVFWVNKFSAMYVAESKFAQLELAEKVGFRVPRTLVSNDRAEIVDFIERTGAVIRKSLILFHWIEDGKSYATLANSIRPDDLKNEGKWLPYSDIYQERIEKKSEIRTFVFGKTFFSVEMTPDTSHEGLVDFRMLHSSPGRVALVELPDEVKRKCLALMAALGVVSAVIEIMKDTEGRYVFTEVNQGGQFLWITQHFPTCSILDAFSEFLISRDPDFEWTDDSTGLTLSSVAESEPYQELLVEEKGGCAPPPFWGV
jgi:glutathione synthase/RimK-type ligase-like ATP-grasp enzyme